MKAEASPPSLPAASSTPRTPGAVGGYLQQPLTEWLAVMMEEVARKQAEQPIARKSPNR